VFLPVQISNLDPWKGQVITPFSNLPLAMGKPKCGHLLAIEQYLSPTFATRTDCPLALAFSTWPVTTSAVVAILVLVINILPLKIDY
jgi:hypothetical protein